jgi:hypothetical protein
VDDDEADAMVTMDVMIAVNNDAVPLVMAMMMGAPKAIAVMVTTTILLTRAPANVTISWMVTTNDDNDNADIGDDGKDSLSPPMTVTTAEMTMGTMGGGGMWRGNATISWTRAARRA